MRVISWVSIFRGEDKFCHKYQGKKKRRSASIKQFVAEKKKVDRIEGKSIYS